MLDFNPAGTPFEPETGEQYEVGIKYQPVGWNSFITVAAFDLTKKNAIRYVGFDPFQTGEIRSRGIEVEGVASFDTGLDVKLAYAYIEAEITDDTEGTEGNAPYGVPRHRASVWADYTIHSGVLEGLGFGGGVRYIGSSFRRRRQLVRGAGSDAGRRGGSLRLEELRTAAQRQQPVRQGIRRLLLDRGFWLLLRREPQDCRLDEGPLVACASHTSEDLQRLHPARQGGWVP